MPLKIPAINKQSRAVFGSVRQQFRMHQGHRLWAGCSKKAVPEIKAGSVLLGKDPVTHIKSLPSAGGCTSRPGAVHVLPDKGSGALTQVGTALS